ncbi:MAG: CRISPR-associated protein Cas5, partial [Taibaiella sp.]|nr:CRISPR-associated protein Cas5 [Taibaiella sp.]
YGGIILTGGGAQLKHIIQLTEYTTGLGARIGYPNEHLAGGYAESLMNPMYSTCIGLILRGYHDYESGKMRFIGEGGNYISAQLNTAETEQQDVEQEEEEDVRDERTTKRTEKMKKLFDGLKGKFMSLFEEVEDEKIE